MRRIGQIVFVLMVFGPLATLLGEALIEWAAGDGGKAALGGVPGARQSALFFRTILFAASVALAAGIAGLFAATSLWRLDRGFVADARWLVFALIAIPPYVHALAWERAFRSLDAFLALFHLDGASLGGWAAAWWVETMAFLPVTTSLGLLGLAAVERRHLEAGRLVRSDGAVYWRIALPLALPQLLAGCGLVFLLSLTEYGLPSVFQVNVYPLELFVLFSGSASMARTLLFALPLLAVAAAVVFSIQGGLRAAVVKPLQRDGGRLASALSFRPGLRVLIGLGGGLLVVQTGVVFAGLAANLGSIGSFVDAVRSAGRELVVTAVVVALAGIAAVPIAAAVSPALVKRRRRTGLWWFLVVAPLAVPAPLVGIGLVLLWNRPSLAWFYDTPLVLVLALLARFLPVAALILAAQYRRVDPLLFDAADVHESNRLRTWLQVRAPMLAPGLMAAGFFVAAMGLGELGATLIVAPPGFGTVTMRIYNYLHYGAADRVAGLCLVLALAALAMAVVVGIGLRAWMRLFPRVREV